MKKLLLGIFLGFLLHKGIEEIYNYKFQQAFASDRCGDLYLKDIENEVSKPLSRRFDCVRDELGIWNYLEYLLFRPHFSDIAAGKGYLGFRY